MASEQSVLDSDYKSQMEEFPCTFNLAGQGQISLCRFKAIKRKLSFELKYESEENSEEENMWKKNMLTWTYFGLGERMKAKEHNDEVFETFELLNNITVLGNYVFLSWHNGDELNAKDAMEKLKTLKWRDDFDFLLAQAKAEQAYCHSRIGGPYHLNKSIELYEEALKIRPDYALWQFGLGLVVRRMIHPNLNFSTTDPMNDYSTPHKAAECFFKVIDNESADSNLQSLTFAELIVLRQSFPQPQYNEVFRELGIRRLCEKALENGSKNSFVLAACGKSLKYIDVDKAISYLEESVKIKKVNILAYHHLGLSYERKATMMAQGRYNPHRENRSGMYRPTSRTGQQYRHGAIQQDRNQHAAGAKSSHFKQAPKSSYQYHKKQIPLDKEDHMVKKAMQAIQESIKLSYDENVPAVFHLARILKRTGQLHQALINFNKVTIFPVADNSFRMTVLDALEEAGLCYIEMSNSAKEPEKSDFLARGKKKLLMAVSLAVEVARRKPELNGRENDIWGAFRTLSTEFEHEKLSPGVAKQKIRLLELVKNYDDILQVIKDLRELGANIYEDEEIVHGFLKSYLELKQYEDAVASIRMLSFETKTTQGDSWKRGPLFDLRIEILLRAILERLQTDANPQELFQQLFEMTYGHCTGVNDNEKEALDSSDSFVLRDVLFVFDEDDLKDSSKGRSTRISRCLKHVLSDVFGLAVEENLRGCWRYDQYYGNEIETQLREMMRYQVVMVVVDDDDRSHEFQGVLDRIPYLPKTNQPTIIVLDVGDQNSCDSLQILKPYRMTKLQDIGEVSGITMAAGGGADVATARPIVEDVFQGDFEAAMKLFCFIVGKRWPC